MERHKKATSVRRGRKRRKDKSCADYLSAVRRFKKGARVTDVAKVLRLPHERVRESLNIMSNFGLLRREGEYYAPQD